MKTIAILTMIFLPGTFFCSLFSTPMMDWNKEEVVGARFWVFWAVTIPTTLAVFVAWFARIKWKWLVKNWEELRVKLVKQKASPPAPSV
jgi:hypothetical protein